jgi:carbon-monoxide dehydrogenase small subunit
MLIKFELNGKDVETEAAPGERLISLLRETFLLTAAKSGCRSGSCGACTIFFNGQVAPACLIPAFRARGSKIVTLEGFRKTPEAADILEGFAEADVKLCGCCDAGKILTAAALLNKNPKPERGQILHAFAGIKCRCTDPEQLTAGVLAAAKKRAARKPRMTEEP